MVELILAVVGHAAVGLIILVMTLLVCFLTDDLVKCVTEQLKPRIERRKREQACARGEHVNNEVALRYYAPLGDTGRLTHCDIRSFQECIHCKTQTCKDFKYRDYFMTGFACEVPVEGIFIDPTKQKLMGAYADRGKGFREMKWFI